MSVKIQVVINAWLVQWWIQDRTLNVLKLNLEAILKQEQQLLLAITMKYYTDNNLAINIYTELAK